jgi:hypothetical protein
MRHSCATFRSLDPLAPLPRGYISRKSLVPKELPLFFSFDEEL